MSIGKNIQTLRKQNNMSQDQLAQKCNVSRQTISRWECDEVLPDTNNLITLSKLFNQSLDEIVYGKQESKVQKKEKSISKTVLSILLLLSITLNIFQLSTNNKPQEEKTIYGTWVYNERGYEIKLVLKENEDESSYYDFLELYKYYKDESVSQEQDYVGRFYEKTINEENTKGKSYRIVPSDGSIYIWNDIIYYDEESNTIQLELYKDFNNKSSFTLEKQ